MHHNGKKRYRLMLYLEKVSKELVSVMMRMMLLLHLLSLLRLKCLKSGCHCALDHEEMCSKHFTRVANNCSTKRCFVCCY